MVRNLAVIPARSGSKRIKDKNIYNFKGKPLLAWTVESAVKSGVFDKVMVSTDSEKYAQIAKEYGAWVPFLRDSAFDDFATIADVINLTVKKLENEYGEKFDNVCSLQVTCPLCNDTIIKETYEDFLSNGSTTTATCSEFNFMNPWWAFKMTDDKQAEFLLSSPQKSRSQDNPPLYCPNGAVIINKIKFEGAPVVKYHPVDWKYGVDIDTYEDIEMAEVLFEFMNKRKNV